MKTFLLKAIELCNYNTYFLLIGKGLFEFEKNNFENFTYFTRECLSITNIEGMNAIAKT